MSDSYAFVDCQGLAGAWTLGTAQTGRFYMAHRVSQPGGFGDQTVALNEGLIAHSPDVLTEEGAADTWTPVGGIAFVCGTPPCSGFSVYNTSKKENFRGPDSPINSCMRDLAGYAGRLTGADGGRGAEIVAFESVQGAFNSGRVLMQALRDILEEDTGQRYGLTHVLMSGATVGAAQYRHRYYFVAHRVPFGIDRPEPRHVTTVWDAIGDLAPLIETRDQQSYDRTVPYAKFAADRLSKGLTVKDMDRRGPENRTARLVEDLCARTDWQQGEYCQDVVRRTGRTDLIEDLFANRWNDDERSLKGLPRHWPKRLRAGAPAWVVTGNSSTSFVHPTLPRVLTVRELSRLMGYPDDWRWPSAASIDGRSSLIGKCCPVDSGRWVSEWAARALDGEPGAQGEEIGDREYLHQCTLDYRRWPEDVSGWNQGKIRRPAEPDSNGKVGSTT
jgi:site-specific DNA-cytosine methylase